MDYVDGLQFPSSYLDIVFLMAFILFVIRPPIAAIVLALGGTAAVLLGTGSPYVLGMSIVTGLVVYSCHSWVTIAYGVTLASLIISVELFEQHTVRGASIAVIGFALVSALIGVALRRGRTREQSLHADVGRLTQEAADAIKMERERIADELHDIIAHDVTIVLMHTRALGISNDPMELEQSRLAAAAAANQAMTDIRRMLHVVQGGLEVESGGVESEPVQQCFHRLSENLHAAGIRVETTAPDSVPVSASIRTTLLHIATESATNILKHAPDSSSARFHLEVSESTVTLRVWNAPDPNETSEDPPSHGYGLRRMEERARFLGGSFTSGDVADGWQVEATLPRA